MTFLFFFTEFFFYKNLSISITHTDAFCFSFFRKILIVFTCFFLYHFFGFLYNTLLPFLYIEKKPKKIKNFFMRQRKENVFNFLPFSILFFKTFFLNINNDGRKKFSSWKIYRKIRKYM